MLGLPSIRSTASFAAGAMLTLVGSRLLPPIVAQARGAARVDIGGDPFSTLIEDHKAIMASLDAIADTADRQVFERTQRFLRLKRRLAAHAMAEEDVVYPLLHGNADGSSDAMRLYEDHAEMKILLSKLEQLPKDGADWHDRAMELRTLIQEHVRREEDEEFPQLRTRLDARAASDLAGKIQRERALLL
jgi:hemerythrin superfamily protein